ncbi:hypothetical protein F444_04441, partial [Phytophthora nicotianae P1976]
RLRQSSDTNKRVKAHLSHNFLSGIQVNSQNRTGHFSDACSRTCSPMDADTQASHDTCLWRSTP